MNIVEKAHGSFVASRRARVLADRLATVVPMRTSVLDVGCGDAEIAWLLNQRRPDLSISGVDVLVRESTRAPVKWFDGQELPFDDDEFGVVTFIDVLHHCDNQLELLTEARRVARQAIVIKDHALRGVGAERTLRFMDGVGNRRYGVALPFSYWLPEQWDDAFRGLGLTVERRIDRLGLYNWPLSLAFDRQLHFMVRLGVSVNDDGEQSPELTAGTGIA